MRRRTIALLSVTAAVALGGGVAVARSTGGSFTAGAPVGLDRFRDPPLVLNAFGADAPTFVRVVPVTGPTPFQLALAPLADAWEVIGVMQV